MPSHTPFNQNQEDKPSPTSDRNLCRS